MMKRVFVSTSCLGCSRDLQEILECYDACGIENVELSGGLDYADDMEDSIKRYSHLNYIIHNYFPPVRAPFIMNLAAQDDSIREKSIELCKTAIDLCAHFKPRLYSFHPGFRVKETLGSNFEIDGRMLVSYEDAFCKFAKSVEEISKHARSKGVNIALENLEHKNDAYMMTRPEEFLRFLKIFPEVGVLLDLGHLNIASRKLNFKPMNFLGVVRESIAEVHIHENDGAKDLHLEPINGDLIEMLASIDCKVIVLEARGLNMERILLNLRFLEETLREYQF